MSTATVTVGVSVWFACGSCRQSFQKLQKFMEHKIQNHFTAFQYTKCIIFEERAIDEDCLNQNACSFSPPAQSSEDEKAHSRLYSPPMIKVESEIHGFVQQPESPHDLLIQRSDLIDLKNDEPYQDFMHKNNFATFVGLENSETNLDVQSSNRTLKVKANNVDMPALNPLDRNSAQKFPCVLLKRLRHEGKQNSPPASSLTKVSLSRSDFTQKQKQDKPVQISSLIPTANSGLRQFKCAHFNCGRIFRKKCILTRHLLFHSDEKLFKCPKENCQKAFKTKTCIRQHLKAHSDARPFKCPQLNCEKGFKDKIGLVLHGATHSDLKSFKCSYPNCRKSFKRKTDLNRHVKRLHFKTEALV